MDEVKKASTMSSVKEYPRKKRIFTKKYYTEELKDAGALKIKTVNGVEQMALKKVSNMTVGLVVAAKGTKSFPDSVIVKWIKPGSKLSQLMERQFLMYEQLVKFLGGGVHHDDIEKWKNLLRTTKYNWPEENDGWSSIFGNETFLSFKIIPVKLLAKDFCSKEKDAGISLDVKEIPILDKSLEFFIKQAENLSNSDNQNEDEVISKQSHRNDSKQSHHSESKKSYHIDRDVENQAIASINVKNNEVDKKKYSKSNKCRLDKENLIDEQKEYSEETMYESMNEADEVSNLGNNIFRDSKENSLQRLSIEYTDLVETNNAKKSSNMNINEDFSENDEKSFGICEDQNIVGNCEENISKSSFYDRKEESLEIQHEETCFEENLVETSPIDQYQVYSSQMDINDVNIDEERKMSEQDIPTGNIENMETESVPPNKPLSEIIIKKKRKKRVIQDDDINDINYKSYRVVVLPEEDVQCSLCERITHTIDNCPDRKRIKTFQNKTVWDRISVKRRTRPKCLNIQNINPTFSVLKCATGSKFLYKNKVEKTTDSLNSSNDIDFYAKSQVKINPNPVKPFISNKWLKPSTNTISMKCDVEKKKNELLSKQIKQLKELLNLFTKNKSNMTLELKKTLLETIKSLQTSIDNIRQQLNNNLDKNQSLNVDIEAVPNKDKEGERESSTKVKYLGNESEKEKFIPSPERLFDKSSIQVQQLKNESEKEKYEEHKKDNVLSQSLRQKNEVGSLPNLFPSPERLLDKSSMKVQHLENESITEKYEELKEDYELSPSSRQNNEDGYSLNLFLSPERLLDKSPV